MKRKWYFVRRIGESEPDRSRGEFEVQLLNSEGQAAGVGFLSADTTTLEINKQCIPLAVLEAAKMRQTNDGDYVDENGKSVPPF